MAQMQQRNPQMFKTMQQMLNSGNDPKQMIKELKQNASPEQMQNVLQQAKQYGVPENILAEVQNMK